MAVERVSLQIVRKRETEVFGFRTGCRRLRSPEECLQDDRLTVGIHAGLETCPPVDGHKADVGRSRKLLRRPILERPLEKIDPDRKRDVSTCLVDPETLLLVEADPNPYRQAWGETDEPGVGQIVGCPRL